LFVRDRSSLQFVAIVAVQQLSFGSTRVRHIDAIDDIHIANNIANCANGLKQQAYNYQWMWKDPSVASPTRNIPLGRYGSASSSSVANSSKVSASSRASSHHTGRSNRSDRLTKQSQIIKSPSSLSNRRSPNLPKSTPEDGRLARGRDNTPKSALGADSVEVETAAISIAAPDNDEYTQRSDHPSLRNIMVHQPLTDDGDVASQSDHSSLISYPEDGVSHHHSNAFLCTIMLYALSHNYVSNRISLLFRLLPCLRCPITRIRAVIKMTMGQ
jgi:hypothetical protein